MSKNRLLKLCAALLAVAAVSTVLLTACSEQPTDFNKVDVITTTKPVTEPVTYVYSELEVLGTKMGMSLEETQQTLNVPIEVRFSETGLVYFAISKSNLDFLNEGLEAAVYFIFDGDARLCEVQYVTTNDTGFVRGDALLEFTNRFGKYATVEEEGKTNYIWFKGGDYIVITAFADGQNAVSYFSDAYFVLTKPELANAYKEQLQEE